MPHEAPPTLPPAELRESRAPSLYQRMRTFDVGRALRGWLRVNKLLTAAVVLLGLFGIGFEYYLPYLAGPPDSNWTYRHVYDFWPTWGRLLFRLIPGLLLIGGAIRLLRAGLKRPGMRRAVALTGMILGGLTTHWLTLYTFAPNGFTHLGRIIADGMLTSYYTVARQTTTGELPPLGETLRHYPDLLRKFPLHASTHPPGPMLACYGVHHLVASHPALCGAFLNCFQWLGLDTRGFGFPLTQVEKVSATAVGVLLVLLGLLGAIPLYGLIRIAPGPEADTEATAWCAAALWAVHPALLVHQPVFDQVYATLTLGCVYCAVRGLRGHPAAWGAGAGALFMMAICGSFTLLFLIPLLGLVAALELARWAGSWRPAAILAQVHPARPDGRRLWLLVGSVVTVCLAVDLALRMAWGIRLFAIFQAAVRFQNEVLLPWINRPYGFWACFNLYDFLFLAGPVAAVLGLAALGRAMREGWRSPAALAPAWAAFPLTLLLLNFLGLTPGETPRIWLFLAPGIIWAAAAELVRRAGRYWRVSLVVAVLAQLAFYILFHCKFKMPDFW